MRRVAPSAQRIDRMFKLQPDSKKELKHMGTGVLLLVGVEILIYAVLCVFGLLHFTYRVPLAALCGGGVTVLNFYLMCVTMQKAVAVNSDPKAVRGVIQLSYTLRMLMLGLWCVAAWTIPCFQFVAGALPLLFPRLVILYLQKTGKYPQGDPPASDAVQEPVEKQSDAATSPAVIPAGAVHKQMPPAEIPAAASAQRRDERKVD